MKNKITFFVLAFSFLLLACQKDDAIVITDNIAPPDYTIESVIVDSYINKLYISLIGREPTETEFEEAKNLLGQEVSQENRIFLIETIQNESDYTDHQVDIFIQDYLNGIDTNRIKEDYIDLYENLIEIEDVPFIIENLVQSLDRLNDLYNIQADFKQNTIDVIEVHRRIIHNVVYDDINMGIENYIVSVSQHFLHRYPTTSELESATSMLEGEQSFCFGGNGDDKIDFNNLFFNHDGYYEGQVITAYNKLLYRNPTSFEQTNLAQQFKQDKSFHNLQKAILITNEFIGIE